MFLSVVCVYNILMCSSPNLDVTAAAATTTTTTTTTQNLGGRNAHLGTGQLDIEL